MMIASEMCTPKKHAPSAVTTDDPRNANPIIWRLTTLESISGVTADATIRKTQEEPLIIPMERLLSPYFS